MNSTLKNYISNHCNNYFEKIIKKKYIELNSICYDLRLTAEEYSFFQKIIINKVFFSEKIENQRLQNKNTVIKPFHWLKLSENQLIRLNDIEKDYYYNLHIFNELSQILYECVLNNNSYICAFLFNYLNMLCFFMYEKKGVLNALSALLYELDLFDLGLIDCYHSNCQIKTYNPFLDKWIQYYNSEIEKYLIIDFSHELANAYTFVRCVSLEKLIKLLKLEKKGVFLKMKDYRSI